MKPILLLLGVALALLGQPAQLDEWVEKARQRFEVPGMAIGIVKDGQVVAARGYGVRRLGGPAAVDAETLFGIASNTKAFTAAALAMLVDEGKLKWDDKVTQYLPAFALSDALVSRELTVRDLLTHRSGLGLGAGDLMFWPDTKITRAQVLAGARHLPMASGLREKYAYNNTLFVVAGEVVAAVSGKPYEQFVEERIFRPLGFGKTRFSNVGLRETDNAAVPHSRGWRLEGELKPIAWNRDDTWAAAAGIKGNVKDLLGWLQLQLRQGESPDGKRLFTEARAREMHAPQTIIPSGPQALLSAYGLGWTLRDYKGRKVISHGGGLTGMVSLTTLVPGEKLGILVLTNQEEGGAMTAVTNLILDAYLGEETQDWVETQWKRTSEQRTKAREKEQALRQGRLAETKPSLAIAAYAGEYRDAWYGKAQVSEREGGLYLAMEPTPAMRGRLEHFHLDTFWVKWEDETIPDALVTFQVNAAGKVERMKMLATSDLADFSFDFHDLDFRR